MSVVTIGGALGLLGAVGLFGVSSASAASEGSAYVMADVQCDLDHNGVLDLTLINERSSTEAVFVVTDAHSSTTAQFTVAPQSAAAVTFTDLDDGNVSVPVAVDGVSADVAVQVFCDVPMVEVLSASASGGSSSPELPATGSSITGLLLGVAMVAVGSVASLAARRRHC